MMDPWNDILLDLPAAVPPAGHIPELDSPSPDYAPALTVAVIGLVVSTIAVLVRGHTIYVKRKVQIPDILVVLAWIFLFPYAILIIFSVQHGNGKHQYDVRVRDGIAILYYIQNAGIMYILMAWLLKTAILLQYFQLLVVFKKKSMGIIIWTTISTITIFYLIILCFLIWQCNPREKIWNPLVPGQCYSWQLLAEASGVFNVISDFALLLIPIAPICKLELSAKKKIQIICIFAIGLIDCIASILRTYYTWVISSTTDQTAAVVLVGHWTWAETTFGFVVACLPSYVLLAKTLRQKFSKPKRAGWTPYRDPEYPRHAFSKEAKPTSTELKLGSGAAESEYELNRAHSTIENEIEISAGHSESWDENGKPMAIPGDQ